MTSSLKTFELRRCQPWLGTFVEVSAGGLSEKSVNHGVQAAFAAIQRVHRLMSFHEPNSELTHLNHRAARAPVEVDAWTYQVLREARRFYQLSGGVFDVAIAPRLMAWGFLPDKSANTRREGSTADIELMAGQRVRFHRPLEIDLGGIAKGFAVDRAIEALRAAGVTAGTVNAGGDLRVFGSRPQPLHIRNPNQPGRTFSAVEISNEAAATSASYFARRRWQGRWVSAILDARSGRPWLDRTSVTVTAPACLWADALTKIVALIPECAQEILARCQARAVIVSGAKQSRSRGGPREFSPCTLAA